MASVVAESKSFDNVHKNLHHHPSLDASGFFMKDESTPIAGFYEEHEEMRGTTSEVNTTRTTTGALWKADS